MFARDCARSHGGHSFFFYDLFNRCLPLFFLRRSGHLAATIFSRAWLLFFSLQQTCVAATFSRHLLNSAFFLTPALSPPKKTCACPPPQNTGPPERGALVCVRGRRGGGRCQNRAEGFTILELFFIFNIGRWGEARRKTPSTRAWGARAGWLSALPTPFALGVGSNIKRSSPHHKSLIKELPVSRRLWLSLVSANCQHGGPKGGERWWGV